MQTKKVRLKDRNEWGPWDIEPTEEMIDAWNRRIEKTLEEKGLASISIGYLAGGCPKCGHLCSFSDKEFKCYRATCGWSWTDELKDTKREKV